jgi:hypothetical protein
LNTEIEVLINQIDKRSRDSDARYRQALQQIPG